MDNESIDINITGRFPPFPSQTSEKQQPKVTDSALKDLLKETLEKFRASFFNEMKEFVATLVEENLTAQRDSDATSHVVSTREDDEVTEAEEVLSIVASQATFHPQSSEEKTLSGTIPEAKTDNMSDLFPAKKRKLDMSCEQPKKSSDDIEEILIQVDKEMPDSEETGPPINEGLAKRVIKLFKKPADTATRKELSTKYRLLENFKDVMIPKINRAIKEMKSYTGYHRRNERDLYDI